jgi:hypothetical protein
MIPKSAQKYKLIQNGFCSVPFNENGINRGTPVGV